MVVRRGATRPGRTSRLPSRRADRGAYDGGNDPKPVGLRCSSPRRPTDRSVRSLRRRWRGFCGRGSDAGTDTIVCRHQCGTPISPAADAAVPGTTRGENRPETACRCSASRAPRPGSAYLRARSHRQAGCRPRSCPDNQRRSTSDLAVACAGRTPSDPAPERGAPLLARGSGGV